MARYFNGLLLAFLLFGVAFYATSLVGTLLGSGRVVTWISLIDISLSFGIPVIVLLAAGIGPIVLAARRALGGRLSAPAAGLLGTVLSPVLGLAIWRLYPEGESLLDLFRFWVRVPGELVMGVIPYATASGFFAGWVAAHHSPSRQPAA